MIKVVITGCQGQVGQCLVQQLSQHAHIEVIALARDALDISDQSAVQRLMDTLKPTVIINAAAYTAVDKAEQDKALAFAINANGPAYLAQAAATHHALLLHISTDYVFDGYQAQPYQENDPVNPQSVYGQSKLAGEQAIVNSDCRYVILRTAWVFDRHSHNFVNTMLRLAQHHTELNVVADQFGGPTAAPDIAATLITIMQQLEQRPDLSGGIYHYAGSPYCSWYEFARWIFQTAQQQGRLHTVPTVHAITTAEYPLPATRPANSRLDCRKIEQDFGVGPCQWQQALAVMLRSEA
ncbi:NAD(P)-dependent oxidoreductase [Shewanella sp. NFH-SH190041]|uniref:dTDP-4-dehydrorhamnose reductase n=1 Tax=Shewanella sp. NFH-SH190041 TaxID=2950245 RepID=UPI0021FC1F01|nr:dTDP-4-dehydrorhamnose reductase [Shewanella sp. NFH-SH190041]BDM62770.1 NAD(P)-dependent oxidoreductase [Shewanella sp. NFH-SH190041]